MSMKRRTGGKYKAKKMKYFGERVKGGPANVQLIRPIQKVKSPSKKILSPKSRTYGFGWGP